MVLWNERGELTETTRANLVFKVDGEWLTPALPCGLLAGTYRAELLARGRVREAVLPLETFERAEKVFLVNSLRGWIRSPRVHHPHQITGIFDEANNRSKRECNQLRGS